MFHIVWQSEEIFSGAVREVKEETGVSLLVQRSYFSDWLIDTDVNMFVSIPDWDWIYPSYSFQVTEEKKTCFLPSCLVRIENVLDVFYAFRHAHNVAFEKSDLFFVCMLRPLSTQIIVDDHEIEAAKVSGVFWTLAEVVVSRIIIFSSLLSLQWMPLVDFIKQPQIQDDNMFKKIIGICIAKLGKRYCGLSVHQLASKFDGKQSSLYFNIVDDQDFTCQPC